MTEPLYTAPGPVFTVAGELRPELAEDVLHLEIEEDTSGLKRLAARFVAIGPREGNAEEQLLYLDGAVLDFGREVEVAIGPVHDPRTVFRGRISALEASFEEAAEPEVVAFAEDELMSLRMTRRLRTYENVSDADIALAIAAEHGLESEVDAEGPTYDVVQQWNMSDLAFLRERARLIQAEVSVAERRLFFQTRERRSGTEIVLVRGNHLLTAQIRADLAHQRTGVRISGYDASERERIDERAEAEAIEAEIAGGRTGPAILADAFGERVSYRVCQVPLVATEAADWARAEMLRRARGFVQVTGTTSGSADLVVGSRMTLERVGTPFVGSGYYVTRVCHSFDRMSGFRTYFEAERPTVGVA